MAARKGGADRRTGEKKKKPKGGLTVRRKMGGSVPRKERGVGFARRHRKREKDYEMRLAGKKVGY